jgi:thiosulfate sulfurtransferase
MQRITVCELTEWRAAGRAFTLIDVRREQARHNDGAEIAGALWKRPEDLLTWKDSVPRDRPVVFVCAHGHELSQGAAATLHAMGLHALYLVDGFAGWRAAGQPVQSLSS